MEPPEEDFDRKNSEPQQQQQEFQSHVKNYQYMDKQEEIDHRPKVESIEKMINNNDKNLDSQSKIIEKQNKLIESKIKQNQLDNLKANQTLTWITYFNTFIEQLNHWIIASPLERISLIICLSALFYVIEYYIPLKILITIGIVLATSILVVYAKIRKWQSSAPLTKFSQETQDLLLEKSWFDLLCDFWYFPGLMRYIVAMTSPMWTGAPPEEAMHNFDDLEPEFKHRVLRKGIIHSFPSWVKKFLMPDYQTVLKENWEKGQKQLVQSQLKNSNSEEIKESIQKNVKFNMQLLKDEIKFKELQKKLQRDVEIKEYYQSDIVYQMKKSHEERINWSNNQIKTIMKFLYGSKHVTQHDKQVLMRIFLGSTLVIMGFLYKKQKSRYIFKKAVYNIIFILAFIISSGSFVLIAKHFAHKNNSLKNSKKN